MKDYTISCTEDITRKAYELGAPLEDIHYDNDGTFLYAENPTAEQMVGWLEKHEKISEISIYGTNSKKWGYDVWRRVGERTLFPESLYESRKEATLAAIKAALSYLKNDNSN